MGSCISKCKPKTIKPQQPRFDFNNLMQDKLVVIPHPPPLTTTTTNPALSLNNKISPYPPSPSPSTSSIYSPTCFSSSITSSNTSFSTASSRSPIFSDEYSWPHYKQNPHVVRINSLKASAFLPHVKPVSPLVRYPSPQRVLKSTPQKRVRAASPSPVRQKSFRKEERPPSPSRRLSGEKCRVAQTKGGSRLKRQLPVRDCGMKREISCIHRISSKIDEVAVREAVINDGDFDSMVTMEDIDNPLISLDCFIFL